MMRNQQTIRQPIVFSGRGIHGGKPAEVTIRPADTDTGIVFCRTDLDGQPEFPALADYVVDTERATRLGRDGTTVRTVEHLLAALSAAGIDNARIEVAGEELPIVDGGASVFMAELESAGCEEQAASVKPFVLDEVVRFEGEFGRVTALPADSFSVTVQLSYTNPAINNQFATYDAATDDFATHIAPARTFCLAGELPFMMEHGLAQGGSLDSAVVYVDRQLESETINRLKAHFEVDEFELPVGGTLNDQPLHFPNEAARHKLLDFVGDLSLVGRPVQARFIVESPGHALNVAFAAHLRKIIKQVESTGPKIDAGKPPLYDIHAIERLLPHRYPFLLIDAVTELSEERVVGYKNLTFNEAFFQGHFPGNAVMPGVLQIEAMAQTGGILALSRVPDPENYWTFFLKIDGAKFRKPVRPGDRLVFELVLTKSIRRGLIEMQARAFVDGQLKTEALLMAQIVRRDKV